MRRTLVTLGVIFVAMLMTLPAGGFSGLAPADPGPNQYIVVLKDTVAAPGAVAHEMAREHGLSLHHVYQYALKGFAAVIPVQALGAVTRDPRVAFVEPNQAYVVAEQTIPTGIDRIEADKNPNTGIADSSDVQVNLDVAIIDTGINSHSDLNLAGGINLAGGSRTKFGDGYGHGTHVAGTVGARDNGFGVVGVAPDVRLWAVKVCNNGGICLTSNMIAGLEEVTACKKKAQGQSATCRQKAVGIDFAAANMSLGTSEDDQVCSSATTDSLHLAVCGLVNSGVPLALAAGNESRVKRAYPEAIAVSAIADFDGKAGHKGAPTCRSDEDDTLANFSNYGPEVDIAAPGICILSTSSRGGYALGSGTSMAAPHVAGAIALYLHVNGINGKPTATNGAEADDIRKAIMNAALPQSHLCGYINEQAAQGSSEPLLFVNAPSFGGDGTCD